MQRYFPQYITLRDMPIIGKYTRNFDTTVGELGLQEAIRKFANIKENDITIHFQESKTKEVLQFAPTLLVCNHPTALEEIPLIPALPPRSDISLLAASYFMGIGPNTDKYILPLFVHRYYIPANEDLGLELIDKLHIGPQIYDKYEHKKNVESMHNASLRITNGGLVILFPTGVRKKLTQWFDGIGYLLKDVKDQKNAYYVKSYIQNSTRFDQLRFLPFLKKILPRVTLTFSQPESIQDIVDREKDPKKIRMFLENEYNDWIKTL